MCHNGLHDGGSECFRAAVLLLSGMGLKARLRGGMRAVVPMWSFLKRAAEHRRALKREQCAPFCKRRPRFARIALAVLENALVSLEFGSISTVPYQYRSEIFDGAIDFFAGADDMMAYSVTTKRLTSSSGEEKVLYLVSVGGITSLISDLALDIDPMQVLYGHYPDVYIA